MRFLTMGTEKVLSENSGGTHRKFNAASNSEYHPPGAWVEVSGRNRDKSAKEVGGAREVIFEDVTVKEVVT